MKQIRFPFFMGLAMGPMMVFMVHTMGTGALWSFVALHVAGLAVIVGLGFLALRWTPLAGLARRLHRPSRAHAAQMLAGAAVSLAIWAVAHVILMGAA